MRSLDLIVGISCLAVHVSAQRAIVDVPFELHKNAVIVMMIANDRDTLRLLLDTGWGPMALTDVALERLQRRAALANRAGWVTLESLAIGTLRKTQVPMEIFEAGALEPLIGPFDGVLATSYFKDQVLQIDYIQGRVRFLNGSVDAARGSSSLPMTFSPAAGSLPFTDSVFVNGRPARGLFDTGGSGAFVAMPRLVAAQRLDLALDSTKARVGFFDGAPRQADVRFSRLRSVRLGAVTVNSALTMLAPPALEGGNWGHDLVIGYGFMRDYVVTFDYPRRRITLTPRSQG